jgi:hypothetical protein
MTQYSRNAGPSTQALTIAVENVQAVVLSNIKKIQNDPRICLQNDLAGVLLLSFPLSTIMLQCH